MFWEREDLLLRDSSCNSIPCLDEAMLTPRPAQGVGLRQRGSYITSAKNPQSSGPANANLPQGAEYPQAYVLRSWSLNKKSFTKTLQNP